jgi:hypothetical protein
MNGHAHVPFGKDRAKLKWQFALFGQYDFYLYQGATLGVPTNGIE